MLTIKSFLGLWFLTLLCVPLAISSAVAQSGKIDSILRTLKNKDLRFDLVTVSPPPSETYDSVRHVFNGSQLQLWVTSIDVNALSAKYPLPALVRGLIPLLDDSMRDWYANLLLYQLSGWPNSGALGIQSREIWILPIQKGSPTTFKDQDIEMWKKYELKLSNPPNK
jgi:hypothetical protein